jgi:transcriptional regulator with XRE-family HTH domain
MDHPERPSERRVQPQPGFRLRELREARGWNQSEVARRAGTLSASQVNRFEAGVRIPKMDHLLALALAFGCTVSELLGDAATARTAGEVELLLAYRQLPLPARIGILDSVTRMATEFEAADRADQPPEAAE